MTNNGSMAPCCLAGKAQHSSKSNGTYVFPNLTGGKTSDLHRVVSSVSQTRMNNTSGSSRAERMPDLSNQPKYFGNAPNADALAISVENKHLHLIVVLRQVRCGTKPVPRSRRSETREGAQQHHTVKPLQGTNDNKQAKNQVLHCGACCVHSAGCAAPRFVCCAHKHLCAMFLFSLLLRRIHSRFHNLDSALAPTDHFYHSTETDQDQLSVSADESADAAAHMRPGFGVCGTLVSCHP